MLTLASLAGEVRAHLCVSDVSNERLFNEMVQPLLRLDGAHNKNGDPIHFDKSRTSRILAGKDDVPTVLRAAAEHIEIPKRLAREYEDFVNALLDEENFVSLKGGIASLCDQTAQKEAFDALTGIDEDSALLLASSMLFATRVNNRQRREFCLWKCGAASLSLVSGDIFARGFENRRREKSIIVICVDTRFQTHVTRSFEGAEKALVSDRTLHGKWIARMELGGSTEDAIHQRIAASLKSGGAQVRGGGDGAYPVGTVASLEEDNAIYYLLAISSFDEKGRAKATCEDVAFALKKLLAFYDEHGQGYDMYLPLAGTGMSRAGLSHGESFDLIRETVQGADVPGRIFVVAEQAVIDDLAF